MFQAFNRRGFGGLDPPIFVKKFSGPSWQGEENVLDRRKKREELLAYNGD